MVHVALLQNDTMGHKVNTRFCLTISQYAAGGSGFTTSGLKVLTGHTRCVAALEVIPSTGHLASVSLDGSLKFWDYIAGTCVHKYVHHEEFR